MKGTTIAIVSCMFLGLEPIFGKILLRYMPPIALAALSSFFAALILFMILEAEHKVGEIWRLGRREFFVLMAVGLISGIIAQLLYVTGLKESTATNAILLTRLNSLLIALFGILFLKEDIRRNHIVGAFLMIAGIIVITTKSFTADFRFTSGDGLLILAAFCWASANILMKKYLTKLPPEVIVVYYHAFAGFVLLSLTAGQIPNEVNLDVIAYMTGFVVLVGIVGRYLWYYSFEHTSACNVGLASLSIPLFGVLYSTTLLGENLTLYQIVGGLLIFGGLVAIEMHLLTHEDAEHRMKRHHPHH